MRRWMYLFVLLLFFGFATQVSAEPQVKLETSMGDIVLSLDPVKAPMTCENFLKYVESGFYNGTIFHRVIRKFMIQGGGLEADMKAKQGRAPIQNESGNGLQNRKYTVAMARTSDPHSATSQFFINTANNNFLDRKGQNWGYAVFGKVIAGKDVVDRIENVTTQSRGMHENVPVAPVMIRRAYVVTKP